jgi:hypothetical protein
VKAVDNTSKPEQWSILDVIEGFYSGNVLEALEGLGIIESLRTAISVPDLARRHRVDAAILEAALNFVARTNLVAQRSGKFFLTRNYDSHVKFMLHQYLGTYGRNALALAAILRDPALGEAAVNRRRHAMAFAQIGVAEASIMADLISQLEFNYILDLGCGTGTLLANLAMRDLKFVGWGLDANPWMCAEARKRIVSARAMRRVKVFEGDCRMVERSVPARIRKGVRAICSVSVANEFFGKGVESAVQWLAGLKAEFPGRVMLLGDYYGRPGKRDTRSREVQLHDFVQTISGQGVPPANLRAWKKIYQSARCQLCYAFHFKNSPFFVHLLHL